MNLEKINGLISRNASKKYCQKELQNIIFPEEYFKTVHW